MFASATGTWLWHRGDTSRLEGLPDETRALARAQAASHAHDVVVTDVPGFPSLPDEAQLAFFEACSPEAEPPCLVSAAANLEHVIEVRHRRQAWGTAAYGLAGTAAIVLGVSARRADRARRARARRVR